MNCYWKEVSGTLEVNQNKMNKSRMLYYRFVRNLMIFYIGDHKMSLFYSTEFGKHFNKFMHHTNGILSTNSLTIFLYTAC